MPDFVVTNFDNEYHALYLSDGQKPYVEATVSSGLARFTQPYVGWGVRFLDVDNNGTPDLLIANGHLHEQIAMANHQVSYREPPLLLFNNGKAQFTSMARQAGPAFESGILGRGLATGDFDNDGAVDAVLVNLNGPPVLLHNAAVSRNAWAGVSLRGKHSNRDAIGSRLTLHTASGDMTRWITGGGSFLASNDRRIVFGLGAATETGTLEIRWPDGKLQTVSGLKLNQYTTIEEQ
jgi:hypothetical protein